MNEMGEENGIMDLLFKYTYLSTLPETKMQQNFGPNWKLTILERHIQKLNIDKLREPFSVLPIILSQLHVFLLD